MVSRPNTKRARLIVTLAALLIPAGEILGSVVIDRAPLSFRFPEAARVTHALRQGGSDAIVFFGSSRFGNDVSAELVREELHAVAGKNSPGVLNAAVSAGDPIAVDFLCDESLKAGIRPSVALIEISPETVSRRNPWFGIHLTRQLRWIDVFDALPDVYWSGELSRLLSSRLIPLYLFRSELQQWTLDVLGAQFHTPSSGDETPPPHTQTRQRELPTPARLRLGAPVAQKRLRDFQIGGASARALERLIERYTTMGTKLVLVGVPVSSPYRSAYVPSIDAAFLNYMHQLSHTYGIWFVDYRHRLPDELFASAYYTTPEGRLSFSRHLAREVVIPLWRDGTLEQFATSPPPLASTP
jgi:hypothetical protein